MVWLKSSVMRIVEAWLEHVFPHNTGAIMSLKASHRLLEAVSNYSSMRYIVGGSGTKE